jgi:ribonuclease G
MIQRILINREESEVRVAFMDDQALVELHTEKAGDQTIVNNVYRGRVQDVVPGLQAAFIDCGLERNMFLHFMDIRPESLVLSKQDQMSAIRDASQESIPGRIERKGRRPRQDPHAPQAASPVKKGDEIIVQVVKDEIGGKAPRVTTNLSLAGRYLVMLPFPSQEGGVSRKIAMGQDRFRLKKLLSSLRNDDHSFIVRTAGVDQPDESILRDAESLQRTWDNILRRYKDNRGPGLLYNDHNLLSRLIRDAFPSEFGEVICDDAQDAEEVQRQLTELLPAKIDSVKLYDGTESVFERYGVEKHIQRAMERKVWLKSGGYLIIDENEALTAIDVNTGKFTGGRDKDQEKTSLRTNIEACEAIAEQIRVRDIGGIIVVDFIDMLSRSHQERVSEELKRRLKNDRAKTAVGRIGDFGLCVMTRKRQRMSLQNQVFDECPYCKGTGLVLSHDEIFRRVKYQLLAKVREEPPAGAILLSAHPHTIDILTRKYRAFLDRLQAEYNVEFIYRADPDYHLEDCQLAVVKKPDVAGLRLSSKRLAEADEVANQRQNRRLTTADRELRTFAELTPIEGEEVDGDEEAQSDLFGEEGVEVAGTPMESVAAPRATIQTVSGPAAGTAALPPVRDRDGRREPAPAASSQPAASGGSGGDRKESTGERRNRRRRNRGRGRGGERDNQAIVDSENTPLPSIPGASAEDDVDVNDAPTEIVTPLREDPRQQGNGGEGNEEGGRRTRRGRRGGRNRRRRDEQPANATVPVEGADQKATVPAPVAAQPESPKEYPRLKMNLAKKPNADLLLDVLNQIEQNVELLKQSAPVAEAPTTPKPAPVVFAPAPTHKPRTLRRRVSEEAEGDLPTAGLEEEIEEIKEVVLEVPEKVEAKLTAIKAAAAAVVPEPAAPGARRRRTAVAPLAESASAKPRERKRRESPSVDKPASAPVATPPPAPVKVTEPVVVAPPAPAAVEKPKAGGRPAKAKATKSPRAAAVEKAAAPAKPAEPAAAAEVESAPAKAKKGPLRQPKRKEVPPPPAEPAAAKKKAAPKRTTKPKSDN